VSSSSSSSRTCWPPHTPGSDFAGLSVCASPGVAVGDALDAALENLAEFSISVRELGRYAQNLGKDRAYTTADLANLAR
jgi:hypothetical protein